MHIPHGLENVLGPGIYLQMKGTSFPPTPKDLHSPAGTEIIPAPPTVEP